MAGGLGGVEGGVGYVGAGQGSDALVNAVGAVGVAVEADVAEVGLIKNDYENKSSIVSSL